MPGRTGRVCRTRTAADRNAIDSFLAPLISYQQRQALGQFFTLNFSYIKTNAETKTPPKGQGLPGAFFTAESRTGRPANKSSRPVSSSAHNPHAQAAVAMPESAGHRQPVGLTKICRTVGSCESLDRCFRCPSQQGGGTLPGTRWDCKHGTRIFWTGGWFWGITGGLPGCFSHTGPVSVQDSHNPADILKSGISKCSAIRP